MLGVETPFLHNCSLPDCVNFHYPLDCHEAESIIYSGISGDSCAVIALYQTLVTLATHAHINVTGFGTNGHQFAVFLIYFFSFSVFSFSAGMANQYDPNAGWRIVLIVMSVLTGLVSLYKGVMSFLAWRDRGNRSEEDEEGYIRIVPST